MLGVLPFVEDSDFSWSAAPALPQHLAPWAPEPDFPQPPHLPPDKQFWERTHLHRSQHMCVVAFFSYSTLWFHRSLFLGIFFLLWTLQTDWLELYFVCHFRPAGGGETVHWLATLRRHKSRHISCLAGSSIVFSCLWRLLLHSPQFLEDVLKEIIASLNSLNNPTSYNGHILSYLGKSGKKSGKVICPLSLPPPPPPMVFFLGQKITTIFLSEIRPKMC